MKIGEHFDVILKYHVPKSHWVDSKYRFGDDTTRDGFELELRQWCRDNLQKGWTVTQHFFHGWMVLVTDEMDYDLLVLKWGK